MKNDKKKLTTKAGAPEVDNQNTMTTGPRMATTAEEEEVLN